MSITRIGIWEEIMEMLSVSSPVTIIVECLLPSRGVSRTRPGGMTIGTQSVMTAGFQSTQGSLGSTQGQSLFKAWSTGTERTERGWKETYPLAAGSTYLSTSA